MGESLVETPTFEEKMGDPMAHVACLQESVSFGRFEHDSLCWERWSTFPTNKYLEEVEKYSTPGSVAQKRAYFEAHYKRIAARKAELMDQENNRENESLDSENQSRNLMDSVSNHSDEEVEVEKSVTHDLVNGPEQEDQSTDFTQEIVVPIDDVGFINEENKVANLTGEVSDSHFDVPSDETNTIIEEFEVVDFEPGVSQHIVEPNDGVDVFEEKHMQPQPDVATEHLCLEEKIIELKPEETDLVKEEAASVSASQYKEEDKELPQVEKEMVKKETEEVVLAEPPKNILKVTSKTTNSTNTKMKTVTPTPKGSAARMSKQYATPAPKSPMLSTPKLSKPVQSRTGLSTTRTSAKKENGPTPLSTTKKGARPESKRMVPTSLHMSLSLAPGNSDPGALTTRRKSLIMESMGDKDIVKRAFKAFRKSNLLSDASLPQSPATSQPVTRKSEHQGSGPGTLQKKIERISRSAKPVGLCSGQGTVKESLPGLRRNTVVDQRNVKSIPSFGSRSLNLGNKSKEVSKKPEQKSMAIDTGRARTPSKATMEKAVEIRRTGRSTNSKPNLSSSWNHGRVSKVLLKEDGKASD